MVRENASFRCLNPLFKIMISIQNVDYKCWNIILSLPESDHNIVAMHWICISHGRSWKCHVQGCRCFILTSMLSHAVMFSLFLMCRSFCIFPTEFPQRTFDTFKKLQKHLDEPALPPKMDKHSTTWLSKIIWKGELITSVQNVPFQFPYCESLFCNALMCTHDNFGWYFQKQMLLC